MEEPVKDEDNEFRPLTPEERRALIKKARQQLPELERRSAEARASLRRIAAGEFPTEPPPSRRPN